MIAILDLDDSILDLETPLRGAFPLIRNLKGKQRYDIRPKILSAIHEHNLLRNLKPFKEAVTLLKTLRENNVQIVFITARAWHPNSEQITRQNLHDNDLYYDDLIICDLTESKGDFLNKNDRYILSIEDNPYNHMNLKESGVENPYCRLTPAFDYDQIPIEELIRCHSEIKVTS